MSGGGTRASEQPAQLVHAEIASAHHQNHIFSGQPLPELDRGSQGSRARAFREGLSRHDLPDEAATTIPGGFEPERAAAALARLVADRHDFDAVVAADYLMAAAAVGVLRAAGIRIPEDVCVAGFGDGPEAEAASVTTVAANVRELGARACRQLIGQIRGLPIRGITVLATELIQRETTRPLA